ncbi:mitochondrial ATP-independent inner membrane protease subunit 1a [Rosa rugosa]|uniref:mitochondrial ATP-independent inner membrane protease subunit 1a n=1 Tax=Rosa rugosa TaxID=74645 RepID=UPI002B4158ED|nr:mitochondrial ATP-independent inner membrane protease subunit 1a [Rosa rugosa]XP_062011763.1 mitochondrial ATP-independent inner membrane protease subunit 1a [Rosa rugosa]
MRLLSHLKQWRAVATEAKHVSFAVAKFIGLIHLTESYLCSSTLLHGPSMLPTFNSSGDVVLAEHLSHRLGKVVPGDVVIVRSPDDPKKMVAKRVLGLEGDKVTFFDPHRIRKHNTTVVPKGHVWIQGDNTYSSFDSRSYGPVPYGLIQGRVFFRVWPPDGFGLVDD